MTTNQVLTDAEIRKLISADIDCIHYPDLPFARAVEQAVLAKVDSEPCRCSRDGYVRKADAERDARKRERAAFVRGWSGTETEEKALEYLNGTDGGLLRSRRDELYPSIGTCDKCGQELK